jgi:hypothetical protein
MYFATTLDSSSPTTLMLVFRPLSSSQDMASCGGVAIFIVMPSFFGEPSAKTAKVLSTVVLSSLKRCLYVCVVVSLSIFARFSGEISGLATIAANRRLQAIIAIPRLHENEGGGVEITKANEKNIYALVVMMMT